MRRALPQRRASETFALQYCDQPFTIAAADAVGITVAVTVTDGGSGEVFMRTMTVHQLFHQATVAGVVERSEAGCNKVQFTAAVAITGAPDGCSQGECQRLPAVRVCKRRCK